MLNATIQLKLVCLENNTTNNNNNKYVPIPSPNPGKITECFPSTYDLNSFKSRINRHLLTVGSF